MKVAYLMSRYPKITETFILNEVLALKETGIDVALFPLQKEKTDVVHPKAMALMPDVTFTPLLSLTMLMAVIKCLIKKPIITVKTLIEVLRFNWGCTNFLLGAIAFFPKAVYLSALCQRKGITHIHAHFANHPAMVAYVINQLSGIGYSFTAHGSDLHKRQHMLKEKFESARFAVMISKYNETFFYQHTGLAKSSKLHIVRCGVDTQLFKPRALVNAPCTQILCVASLREVKGHRYLIEACALLKKQCVNFHLTLIGDGPMREELTQQVHSFGLTNEVTFLGAQPQEVILEHLANSDIFTLTSYQTTSGNREGIPVVIMEAMACGLPVVASNVSGIPELVKAGETGLLCETQNPASIAEQLKALSGDAKQRQIMGAKGRAFVLDEFDLNKNARKLATLFEQYHS